MAVIRNLSADQQENQGKEPDYRHNLEKRLNAEFKRVNSLTGLNLDLKVICAPRNNPNPLGEVLGKSIIIYESDEEEAIKVLRHEVLDYIVCQAILPYQEMTNILIKKLNDDAYQRKEKLVDALTNLLE